MQGLIHQCFLTEKMSCYYEKNIKLYRRKGIITFLRGETNKPGDDKKVHPLLSPLYFAQSFIIMKASQCCPQFLPREIPILLVVTKK